nr:cysteine-rich venom protein 6-like isoform X2 [Parasteatoda tepidariorum]
MYMLILLGLVIGAFADECPSNSHFNDCGSACPITCENYKNPPTFCIRICVDGCHCDEDEGYVKTKDGRCVLPEDCGPNDSDANNCLAQPDAGLCRGSFESYYYDPKKGDCFQFIYGGCGGNSNRYSTYDECKSACAA